MKANFLRRLVTLGFLVSAMSHLAVTSVYSYEQEIDGLARHLAERIASEGKKTVAVVDFTDVRGTKTELGRFLAEEMSVALLNTGQRFRVIDRAHLSRILEESRLGESGIIDPATAKELGRVAGVDALITGTLTSVSEGVRLAVKVLETETATVIAGQRTTLPASGELRSLLARGLGPEGGSSPQVQSYTKAYDVESREAGGLRVTARSVRVLNEGKVAALFELANITAGIVTVFVADSDRNSAAYDDRGNFLPQYSGLPDSDGCVVGYGGTDGLVIQPGESQQITEIYEGDRDAKFGEYFTLKLSLRICRGLTRNIPGNREGDGDESGSTAQFSFADIPADLPTKGR